MKPTLVIMAAGMASRYGSMKQIQQFGPGGETIMDYSIYDSIQAGFGKVVFIIRKDFAEDFKAIFEPKLQGKIETAYAYQELTAFVGDFAVPAERKKPWGTSHAILCAREVVQGPFAVINADDFYGRDGFVKAAQFLNGACNETTYALVGYPLAKTLSQNGTVSRGVCETDGSGNLTGIEERLKISRQGGQMVNEEGNGTLTQIPEDAKASMNFWCFHPSLFGHLEAEFGQFLKEQGTDPKAEFLIPLTVDKLMESGKVTVQVLPTDAQWFGVTYKEDAPVVTENINQLVQSGTYNAKLW